MYEYACMYPIIIISISSNYLVSFNYGVALYASSFVSLLGMRASSSRMKTCDDAAKKARFVR